jgi:hypothetical protein
MITEGDKLFYVISNLFHDQSFFQPIAAGLEMVIIFYGKLYRNAWLSRSQILNVVYEHLIGDLTVLLNNVVGVAN